MQCFPDTRPAPGNVLAPVAFDPDPGEATRVHGKRLPERKAVVAQKPDQIDGRDGRRTLCPAQPSLCIRTSGVSPDHTQGRNGRILDCRPETATVGPVHDALGQESPSRALSGREADMVRRLSVLTWIAVVQLSCAGAAAPAGQGTPEGWFSARRLGAVGDGRADDTAAVQRGNYAGVTSAYAQVDEPSAAKGYLNTSDWTVSACELHDLSTQGRKGTRSKLTALRLDNTMQMRWVGGNISGEGGKLIHLTGRNHHITFVGTTLYSEVGFPASTVFHVAGALDALSATGCVMQAAGSVIRADPGMVLDQLHLTSKPALGPGGLLIDRPGATLRGSLLHCAGLGLRLQAIESTLLIGPGRLTADRDRSTRVQ